MKKYIARTSNTFFVYGLIIGVILCSRTGLAGTITREVTTTTTTGPASSQEFISKTPMTPQRSPYNSELVREGYPGKHYRINFGDLDLSRDGILSVNEISGSIFKLYDEDGNSLIDNNEYERRAVLNIIPAEKNTVVYYDYDGDGDVDETAYTYETFARDMQFSRFDAARNGISPHDFTKTSFNHADINNDRFVNEAEWQRTAIPVINTYSNRRASFNK